MLHLETKHALACTLKKKRSISAFKKASRNIDFGFDFGFIFEEAAIEVKKRRQIAFETASQQDALKSQTEHKSKHIS